MFIKNKKLSILLFLLSITFIDHSVAWGTGYLCASPNTMIKVRNIEQNNDGFFFYLRLDPTNTPAYEAYGTLPKGATDAQFGSIYSVYSKGGTVRFCVPSNEDYNFEIFGTILGDEKNGTGVCKYNITSRELSAAGSSDSRKLIELEQFSFHVLNTKQIAKPATKASSQGVFKAWFSSWFK